MVTYVCVLQMAVNPDQQEDTLDEQEEGEDEVCAQTHTHTHTQHSVMLINTLISAHRCRRIWLVLRREKTR